MGRAILCTGSTAKIPYILRKLDIAVYTVEELCYCIRENTVLIDEDAACGALADWLRDECALPELAQSLHTLLKKKVSVGSFLTAILEYTGFYSAAEIKRIGRFLESGAGMSEYERQKKVADYLAESGKYELALEQYGALAGSLPPQENALAAHIYHNMGCVNGRLFLFDRAAELYRRAYELSGERESLMQFLAAKRLELDEKAYVDFIVDQPEEYYRMSMELEGQIERTAERWLQSDQVKALAEPELGDGTDGREQKLYLQEAAQQLKERYRSMVREK